MIPLRERSMIPVLYCKCVDLLCLLEQSSGISVDGVPGSRLRLVRNIEQNFQKHTMEMRQRNYYSYRIKSIESAVQTARGKI